MNINEFRKNPALVKEAAKTLARPEVQLLITTLRDSMPFKWSVIGVGGGVQAHDHSRMLGLVEGYDMALSYLRQLGELPSEQLPAIAETYAEPEPPTEP